jgi:HD-GYP domain-containing protein (c-di-GMP phosphodiesterase class II)
MTTSLYERSSETEAHANRLYELSAAIASKFSASEADLNELELFAKLHDIGKIGIPDEILNKPSRLTDEEWETMKKHPEIGFRIANSTQELKAIGKYILSHHERYDGTGYPKGLKGSNIPLLSRILSVVDAFDAMTHDRPYRKALKQTEAIQEIEKNAGTQFDPSVVNVFLEIIQKELN